MKYVALTGGLYSGKTTLATELEKRGYMILSFTDVLKACAATALAPYFGGDYTVEDIKADKANLRTFLQEFGRIIGFDWNPGFVNLALQPWWQAGLPPAVFDNVRFDEQFDTLRPYGFDLVRVSVPFEEQKKRAKKAGVYVRQLRKMLAHPAEAGLSYTPHLDLDGTRPVEELADDILAGAWREGVTLLAKAV
jgi:hypothetical protein